MTHLLSIPTHVACMQTSCLACELCLAISIEDEKEKEKEKEN